MERESGSSFVNEGKISSAVREILSTTFKLDPNVIKFGANLKDDLGLDSVDLMDSICLLEERFKTKFSQEELQKHVKVETFAELVALIGRKLADK